MTTTKLTLGTHRTGTISTVADPANGSAKNQTKKADLPRLNKERGSKLSLGVRAEGKAEGPPGYVVMNSIDVATVEQFSTSSSSSTSDPQDKGQPTNRADSPRRAKEKFATPDKSGTMARRSEDKSEQEVATSSTSSTSSNASVSSAVARQTLASGSHRGRNLPPLPVPPAPSTSNAPSRTKDVAGTGAYVKSTAPLGLNVADVLKEHMDEIPHGRSLPTGDANQILGKKINWQSAIDAVLSSAIRDGLKPESTDLRLLILFTSNLAIKGQLSALGSKNEYHLTHFLRLARDSSVGARQLKILESTLQRSLEEILLFRTLDGPARDRALRGLSSSRLQWLQDHAGQATPLALASPRAGSRPQEKVPKAPVKTGPSVFENALSGAQSILKPITSRLQEAASQLEATLVDRTAVMLGDLAASVPPGYSASEMVRKVASGDADIATRYFIKECRKAMSCGKAGVQAYCRGLYALEQDIRWRERSRDDRMRQRIMVDVAQQFDAVPGSSEASLRAVVEELADPNRSPSKLANDFASRCVSSLGMKLSDLRAECARLVNEERDADQYRELHCIPPPLRHYFQNFSPAHLRVYLAAVSEVVKEYDSSAWLSMLLSDLRAGRDDGMSPFTEAQLDAVQAALLEDDDAFRHISAYSEAYRHLQSRGLDA